MQGHHSRDCPKRCIELRGRNMEKSRGRRWLVQVEMYGLRANLAGRIHSQAGEINAGGLFHWEKATWINLDQPGSTWINLDQLAQWLNFLQSWPFLQIQSVASHCESNLTSECTCLVKLPFKILSESMSLLHPAFNSDPSCWKCWPCRNSKRPPKQWCRHSYRMLPKGTTKIDQNAWKFGLRFWRLQYRKNYENIRNTWWLK